MNHCENLYQILQVDSKAEKAVIESAYKCLCKIYHPDLNKTPNSEEKMKEINHAYQVLRNTKNRENYDIQFQQNSNDNSNSQDKTTKDSTDDRSYMAQNASTAIYSYFQSLLKGDFSTAYQSITPYDKENISWTDFLEWQTLISSVYELGNIECIFYKKHSHLKLNDITYRNVYEFGIKISEKNLILNVIEQSSFNRYVIENGLDTHVFLGYKDIKASLVALKRNFLSMKNLGKSQEKARMFQAINLENERALRYKNRFSLVLFELKLKFPATEDTLDDLYNKAIVHVIEQSNGVLRKPDIIGKWNDNRIILLLPETSVLGARRACERIFTAIKSFPHRELQLALYAGIIQNHQSYSVEELIDLLSANLIAAKKKNEWQIVASRNT